MGRSRSRSPSRREKRRSRSKDRDRDRERRRRHKSRSRSPRSTNRKSRSRSPQKTRSRSGSRDNDVVFVSATKAPGPVRTGVQSIPGRHRQSTHGTSVSSDDGVIMVEDDTDEASMMKLMGFSDFNTTKGKHVKGNDTYAANIVQKRKYRQYMNRRGGFNRPLDFVA